MRCQLSDVGRSSEAVEIGSSANHQRRLLEVYIGGCGQYRREVNRMRYISWMEVVNVM